MKRREQNKRIYSFFVETEEITGTVFLIPRITESVPMIILLNNDLAD